jgi:hypothetical protein
VLRKRLRVRWLIAELFLYKLKMIDPSDLIKESKRGGKGATPFDDEDRASPDKRKPVLLPGVNVITLLVNDTWFRNACDRIFLQVLKS